MTWIILVLAGLFEVVWAVGLKYTHGFTRLVPSLVTVASMAISFWLLALAMKTCRWAPPMPSGWASAPSAPSSPASCCSGNPPAGCASSAWD